MLSRPRTKEICPCKDKIAKKLPTLNCAPPSPVGTYSNAAKTECIPCPGESRAPPSSSSIDECLCPADTYPLFSSSRGPCAQCPVGAKCDPTVRRGQPLAVEGYWRAPPSLRFYSCRSGMCLAEASLAVGGNVTAIAASAAAVLCRPGHTGILCSLCQPGFSYQGDFCVPCGPGEDIRTWSRGRRGIAVAGFGVLALLLISVVLLSPLTVPAIMRTVDWMRQLAQSASNKEAAPSEGSKLASIAQRVAAAAQQRGGKVWPYISYAKVPLRLMIGA